MARLAAAAVLLGLVGLVGVARADDKASPTGTWKWSVTFNDQTFEMTLKLKQEGDKLTGTLTGRQGQETKIDDGMFKDGKATFKVTREFNNQKFTTKYEGKLSGDTIKGKAETEFNGETRSRDWEAKRAKG
jgi:hypothetical protein